MYEEHWRNPVYIDLPSLVHTVEGCSRSQQTGQGYSATLEQPSPLKLDRGEMYFQDEQLHETVYVFVQRGHLTYYLTGPNAGPNACSVNLF